VIGIHIKLLYSLAPALLPGALFEGDDMVCYIKEFGRHGADPAKICDFRILPVFNQGVQ